MVFTAIGLIFAAYGFCYSLPKSVEPDEVVLFGFIRGYESFNQSDCLVLGIIWENPGGEDEIIENPKLKLERLNQNSVPPDEFTFIMRGDFSEITDDSISNGYERKFAYILEPHSKIVKYIIFRPEYFWNESHPDYKFNFTEKERYRISITYSQGFKATPEKFLFIMPVYENERDLKNYGESNYSYDFFPVLKDMKNDTNLVNNLVYPTQGSTWSLPINNGAFLTCSPNTGFSDRRGVV